MDYLFSQYTDNSLEQRKLLTPCSETIWGTSSSAEFGLCKKYKNPKCSEGVVSVEVDVLIPPGGHAQLWAKPAEDGSGVWQELGAGEKCAFWLKITAQRSVEDPRASNGSASRWQGGSAGPAAPLASVPGAAVPGPKARGARQESPGAQINQPDVLHSPGRVFAVYTAQSNKWGTQAAVNGE